jgi:hypothetical protein
VEKILCNPVVCKSMCLQPLTIFKVGLTFLYETKWVLANSDEESEPDFKSFEGL